MQTHRASCEMAREENLTRRRRSRGSIAGAAPGWCKGRAEWRMRVLPIGGWICAGATSCKARIVQRLGCVAVRAGDGVREAKRSWQRRCALQTGEEPHQEGKKELMTRGLSGSDQVLTQLRARLCTAFHGQQESNPLHRSLLRVSLDRALGQSPHTPISIQELDARLCHTAALNALPPT